MTYCLYKINNDGDIFIDNLLSKISVDKFDLNLDLFEKIHENFDNFEDIRSRTLTFYFKYCKEPKLYRIYT